MEFSTSIQMPDILDGKVQLSNAYENYNANGTRTSFGIDLRLDELSLHKEMKAKEFYLLGPKVQSTLDNWAKKMERHRDVEHKRARAGDVEQMNEDAVTRIREVETLLAHTLGVDDTVDWDALKRKDAFRIKPENLVSGLEDSTETGFVEFNSHGRPTGYEAVRLPAEPTIEEVTARHGFFTKMFGRKKIQKGLEFELDSWKFAVDKAKAENERRAGVLDTITVAFERLKRVFQEKKHADNDAIEALKARYLQSDDEAIEEYCELVLGASEYPDYFPQTWVLEYRPNSQMVLVEYDLPAPSQLPTVASYSYVKSRDQVTEKKLTAVVSKKLYESAIYQVCIRTLHELFEADVVNAIGAVVFNGCVTDVNPATGVSERKMILSVSGDKEEFMQFDLANIDPKRTFKHLKGVAATALSDLAPIPPVVSLDKTDKRFVDGRTIVGDLDESVNVAAMEWEDFEHLVRELFEKEFSAAGGEVRITQASSDGGVDAIAFDPDPIRGGKVVIQAKRYTNTVGVAAVRDLYGTVMNEGATKGILVTTADYGKDSYEFAKDKPITLLNGNNLLSLLEKHGTRARINVAEAREARRKAETM